MRGIELPLSAVNEQQVGPRLIVSLALNGVRGTGSRILLQQALEAPLNNFTQHAVIVTGRQVGRPDVELAILILPKSICTGYDHRSHGIGTADVAIVVNLDPARGTRQ